MQGEPPTQASTPTGAVFLSYASQDAGAAQRICEALRAAGIEVWFDQSELRGGDAWDHKIRDQIHDCRLFIPVISANTERRDEGYFRREWSLAVDRTRDMAHKRTFLLPVVIDGTPERSAAVPDKFHELQWTRLPGGETPPAFVDRIRQLLTPDVAPATTGAAPSTSGPVLTSSTRRSSWSKVAIWGASAIAAVAGAYFVANKVWLAKQPAQPEPPSALTAPQTTPSAGAPFHPPPLSIAVLPFVNLSGDKNQEYFSDGLTEELLNSLSRINELQVAGRTSSFYFKGEHADISTIAHKLNVASLLEGSVRRSGNTVRITTQLTNAVTGFHLWSQTYDRSLADVLKLQTEIANAVTQALKIKLLSDGDLSIEIGGTHNPQAFDAYLRATHVHLAKFDPHSEQTAIASYSEAVRLDPGYALAFAGQAIALEVYGASFAPSARINQYLNRAQIAARRAVALAPELAEGHLALAIVYDGYLDFTHAAEEHERARELAPGNVRVLRNYADFFGQMGNTDAALQAARRAVTLDPLSLNANINLASTLRTAKRYKEAIAALHAALALDPDFSALPVLLGETYYLVGDYPQALSWCERSSSDFRYGCLAVTYNAVGQRAKGETMLEKLRALRGDAEALSYVAIYAQWGDKKKALDALDTSFRLRDPGLRSLKVDPYFDPLRHEPRFQAVERALKFPD
jgi:TolB-like protein